MTVSLAEVESLLAELPPPMDPREAEDDEDRQRIALHAKIRTHLDEPRKALEASADATATGTVILSTDEVDEILDCLPPPPAMASVRDRLGELRRSL